jgi:hypothetical protein
VSRVGPALPTAATKSASPPEPALPTVEDRERFDRPGLSFQVERSERLERQLVDDGGRGGSSCQLCDVVGVAGLSGETKPVFLPESRTPGVASARKPRKPALVSSVSPTSTTLASRRRRAASPMTGPSGPRIKRLTRA